MNINETNPALIALVHSFEVIKKSNPAVDKVREVFLKRKGYVASLVEKGKEEKIFSDRFDSDFIATTIVGIIRTVLTEWRMSNYSFKMKETALKYILNFLEMCKA